jgi:predicted transcriptional regulator
MSTVTIELPESLKNKIEALATKEGYSDYLRREAAAGRRTDFERYLASVPNVPPQPGDEL